jgi:hypothetical protein
LQSAGAVKNTDARRQRANDRSGREQAHAPSEDPSSREAIGERSGAQHDGRKRDRVRINDPLHTTQAGIKVTGDLRQGCVDDRDLKHQHRGREADDGERAARRRFLRSHVPPMIEFINTPIVCRRRR